MYILELFFALVILYFVLFNPIRHQAIPINFMFNIHSLSTVFQDIYVSWKRDRCGIGNILNPLVENSAVKTYFVASQNSVKSLPINFGTLGKSSDHLRKSSQSASTQLRKSPDAHLQIDSERLQQNSGTSIFDTRKCELMLCPLATYL